MAKKGILYDAFGNEITWSERPPADRMAEVGRLKDPWASKSVSNVTPESLARLMRGDTELSERMLLCKLLLKDPHISACMRNLALSIGALDWEFLPFDPKSPAAKKQAEEVTRDFKGLRWFKKLITRLVYGEWYPFVGAETDWSEDYIPRGFDVINPPRWTWNRDLNAVRLRTIRQPQDGEPLTERGFVLHAAQLEPGTILDGGMWQKCAWLWLFKNSSWSWWMRFAEAFGNPYIWAFFARPEDKDSVLEAITSMAGNARAAFPKDTEVKLQEAQRYGTVALYKTISDSADAGITKVIQGHVLNTDTASGSGTLAGNHAESVSQVNMQGVAAGISESIQEGLAVPYFLFRVGRAAIEANEICAFSLKSKPPEDKLSKAQTWVAINPILNSAGQTIAPDQIKEEYGLRTIPFERPAATTPVPPGETKNPAKPEAAKSRAAAPRLRTAQDVTAATTVMVRRAAEEFSEKVAEIFEGSDSIEEGMDALWESYGALDTKKLASAIRDASEVGEMIGRGDVIE